MRHPGLLDSMLITLTLTSIRGFAQATNEPYRFIPLAGNARQCGSTDGTGSGAQFGPAPAQGAPPVGPNGVAGEGAGVYEADSGNHTIRKVMASGVVTTYTGQAALTLDSAVPGLEMSGGVFRFGLTGPRQPIVFEASSDLTNRLLILANASTSLLFADSHSGVHLMGFYRAILQ